MGEGVVKKKERTKETTKTFTTDRQCFCLTLPVGYVIFADLNLKLCHAYAVLFVGLSRLLQLSNPVVLKLRPSETWTKSRYHRFPMSSMEQVKTWPLRILLTSKLNSLPRFFIPAFESVLANSAEVKSCIIIILWTWIELVILWLLFPPEMLDRTLNVVLMAWLTARLVFLFNSASQCGNYSAV